jgi:hypothetical protein
MKLFCWRNSLNIDPIAYFALSPQINRVNETGVDFHQSQVNSSESALMCDRVNIN